MSDPIIRVENLRTGFGDFVLHESVSFDVQKGANGKSSAVNLKAA